MVTTWINFHSAYPAVLLRRLRFAVRHSFAGTSPGLCRTSESSLQQCTTDAPDTTHTCSISDAWHAIKQV